MNTLKVGDKVTLLNYPDIGIVKQVLPNNIYKVDFDGFITPHHFNELVLRFKESDVKQKTKSIETLPTSKIEFEVKNDVYLSIAYTNNCISISIVNNVISWSYCIASIFIIEEGIYNSIFTNQISSREVFKVLEKDRVEINSNYLNLHFKVLYPDKDKTLRPLVYEQTIKLSINDIVVVCKKEGKFIHPLRILEKEESERIKAIKKEILLDVIDLHKAPLEQLLNTRFQDAELLTHQLNTIRKYIMRFREQKVKESIIFIHGIGQGVLREKLYQIVSLEAPDCEAKPASIAKYGDGATQICLKIA